MAGAALCEPPCADFVAGAALCDLHVQISWQVQRFTWQEEHFVNLHAPLEALAVALPPCADFVAGAALCEARGADFVAGAAVCEPPCADYVVGTALCEPPCAEFVAGAALCEPPCSIRGSGCCVVGSCRWWSSVRPSIVIRVFTCFLTRRCRGRHSAL